MISPNIYIKKIIMINEVVFADRQKINDKKKTIGLTYSKNNRVNNNANPFDKLGTEEMDQENANTIEVPLKGGLISYNITDIKGTEIMHYFKKKWAQRQRVEIDVKQRNGNRDKYELEMDKQDEREFINRFIHKVELVIKAWINKNKKQDLEFSSISILPVDSTSRFNEIFVKKELSNISIYGLECRVVDPKIIVKDAKNIQRDEEFIKNNTNFYNSDYAIGKPEMGTVNQRVDNIINKYNALNIVNDKINQINFIAQKLLNFLNNNRNYNEFSPLQIKNLIYNYKLYVDLIRECYSITYTGTIDNQKHSFNHDEILNTIKYSKSPSIDNRSSILWKMVKPHIRGEISQVDGKKYKEMPLCLWKKTDFEIKKLRNSERLGLKNIYGVNSEWDDKKIMDEINKIKGTILLIFDDNISGGATLSDICLQCKKLGLENIIPITFGKMSESNSLGGITLNTPKDGFNFSTNNDLSVYSGQKKEKRQYLKKDETLNLGKKKFYKTHDFNKENQTLNILWLDDIREPYSYFSSPKNSIAWKYNNDYYNNYVFNHFNPNFIWVKNLKEFQKYILNNEMPNMISFDHDITPRNYNGIHETGEDIAQWLVDFCKKNNINLPWTFVHSANKKGGERITDILKNNINEDYNHKKLSYLTENKINKIINETLYKYIYKNNH